MKIAIDNRVLKYSGIGNYIYNLVETIKTIESSYEIFLYDDSIEVNQKSFKLKYINGLKRLAYEQVYLNKWLKNNNIDILHNPKNLGVPFFVNTPTVVTIHDVIPHVFSSQYLKTKIDKYYYEIFLRNSIRRSCKIITVSEFSKQQIMKFYNVKGDKIVVTHLGCNKKFKKIKNKSILENYRKKLKINKPFILTIGGSEYRKNVISVINAFKREIYKKYDLIVVGSSWRNYDLSKKFKDNQAIKFFSNIDEDLLVVLYNLADAFIFPSFYEGFGLPVLEAMSCQVPVITSNVSSLPEVAGNAALYVNPYDIKDIEEKMKKMLTDRELQKEYIGRGLEQLQKFSWEITAKKTIDVYNKCL